MNRNENCRMPVAGAVPREGGAAADHRLKRADEWARERSDSRQPEAGRNRNEAVLRSVFLAAPVGLCVVDGRTIRTANRAWYELVGYGEEEIVGNTTRMLYADDEEYARVGRELYGQNLKRGVARVETRLLRKDGEWREVVLTAAPLDPENHAAGAVVAIEDVTERRRTEQALREKEEMHRALVETSPDPIIIYALDGRLIAANRQAAALYGVESVEEFLAASGSVFALLTEEGQAKAAANFPVALAAGHSRGNEYQLRLRNGKTIIAEANTALIRDGKGDPQAFLSIIRDITARKRSERILMCQRDLGMALIKASSLPEVLELCLDNALKAVAFDAGGIYLFDRPTESFRLACSRGVSAGFAAHARLYPAGSVRAERLWRNEALYVEGPENLAACPALDLLIEGMRSVAVVPIRNQERVIGSLNLASRVFDVIPPSSRDALETIANQIATAIVRMEMEDHLRESEGKFRDLAEKSIVGIYLIQDGRFRYVNGEFAAILGYHAEEMVDLMGPRDVIYPEDLPVVEENIRRRIAGEIKSLRYEFRVLTRDGRVRYAEVYSSRTAYRGTPAVIGTLLDITDRRRAEEELRRLSVAIERTAEGVLVTDEEGSIQYVNPAFEALTGYPRGEAMGRTPEFLQDGLQNDDSYRRFLATIKGGDVWKGRLAVRGKNGNLHQVDTTVSPLIMSNGKLTGYVVLGRDVTEAVRMEAQLRQSQKMEAIGTLAGGIAHDFNNILGAMMGYAELARFKNADAKIHPYLDQILTACDRARDLVRQILSFSRQQETEKRPMAVTPIVKEAMKLLRSSLPATVEIRQSYHISRDTVLADPTQIHQVLMNLCTNALYAMRNQEGVLEVRLEEKEIAAAGSDQERQVGPYLQLVVRDTGEGIDPAVKDRIFDPFFTTKKAGEGTGLGLSVVYGIVRDCGGEIHVESEPGRGTTFTVLLPLIAADGRRDELTTVALPRGQGRILFVDDEAPIATLGQEMLASLGYEVAVRFSSHDALAAFRAQPERFDLVITDMTMPNMTGAVLTRELLKIRPDLPVILTTGFSERINAEEAKQLGIREFLMKPVSLMDLAQAVQRVMEKRTNPAPGETTR